MKTGRAASKTIENIAKSFCDLMNRVAIVNRFTKSMSFEAAVSSFSFDSNATRTVNILFGDTGEHVAAVCFMQPSVAKYFTDVSDSHKEYLVDRDTVYVNIVTSNKTNLTIPICTDKIDYDIINDVIFKILEPYLWKYED